MSRASYIVRSTLLETPELHISPVNIVDYLQHVPDVVLRVYGEHHSHCVVIAEHEELAVVVLEVVLHDYVIPVGDVVLEDDFICGVDAHDCFALLNIFWLFLNFFYYFCNYKVGEK